MVDNQKVSRATAPGPIAGYIVMDPVTHRWSIELRGSARISVTADDAPQALSLAAFTDQVMAMAWPDPAPDDAEFIEDAIAEIKALIAGGATLKIEDVQVGADLTAAMVPVLGQRANDTVVFGAPARPWPVWPEAGRGLALVGEQGPEINPDTRPQEFVAVLKRRFLGL